MTLFTKTDKDLIGGVEVLQCAFKMPLCCYLNWKHHRWKRHVKVSNISWSAVVESRHFRRNKKIYWLTTDWKPDIKWKQEILVYWTARYSYAVAKGSLTKWTNFTHLFCLAEKTYHTRESVLSSRYRKPRIASKTPLLRNRFFRLCSRCSWYTVMKHSLLFLT